MNFISHIENIPTESSSAQLQQQASRSQPTEITKTTYRYCQCTFSARCFHIFHYHTHTHRQAAKQAMMRTKGRRWSTVIIHTITHTRGAITTRPAPGPTHAVHNSTPKTNLSYSSYFCHIFPLVRRRHTAELQLSQAAYVIMIL